jgi:hypothetical protein
VRTHYLDAARPRRVDDGGLRRRYLGAMLKNNEGRVAPKRNECTRLYMTLPDKGVCAATRRHGRRHPSRFPARAMESILA